jgi:hypothetical protein
LAYDGNGTYVRLYSWVQDAANNVNISASRVDAEDSGFAAGLTLAVTRDGQGKMTSDFLPNTDNTLNLGTAVKRWKSINGVSVTAISSLAGDIRNYGAVSGADCATAVTAAAAANSLVIIPSGTWPMAGTPTIGADVVMQALPGATFSGAGASALGFASGALNQIIEYTTVGTDLATNYFFRNADHTGGTPGFVSSAVRIQANVIAGATNYEWAFLSVLNNSATGGQNVAGYLQGNRQTTGTGPTWAGVCEARETVAINNPTTGLIGLEVDSRSNGTDSLFNRVGIDVVCIRYNMSGAATTVGWGVRVQSGGDLANTTINSAFSAWQCTTNVAFDCANATVTSGSLRMAQSVPVLFDVNGTQKLASQGLGLDHLVSGTLTNRFLSAGGLQVLANQVVGPRSTGWTAMTGTPDQSTAFATSTVTLAQLAGRVMALQAMLTTHGLCGT